jgi:hypothetical protein
MPQSLTYLANNMRIIVRLRRRGAAFRHPFDPAPRTAVLAPGFAENGTIRVFPQGWSAEARRFRPTSIAGRVDVLRALARRPVDLRHAVIVFTDLEARLEERDREFLWQAFGVPVFEQCLDAQNRLLAGECEAHEGLHLWGRVPAEWDGSVERGVCACGSAVPRLMERKGIMVAMA